MLPTVALGQTSCVKNPKFIVRELKSRKSQAHLLETQGKEVKNIKSEKKIDMYFTISFSQLCTSVCW